MTRRVTLRIEPPDPFGDVTVVPALLGGRPEADLAQAMAGEPADAETPTVAEIQARLSRALPLAPLSARVAALAKLMDRLRHPTP